MRLCEDFFLDRKYQNSTLLEDENIEKFFPRHTNARRAESIGNFFVLVPKEKHYISVVFITSVPWVFKTFLGLFGPLDEYWFLGENKEVR